MKKVIISAVAISALATTSVWGDSASDIAEMKAMMKQMNIRVAKLEKENNQLKSQVTKREKSHHKTTKKIVHSSDTATDELTQKYAKATPVFAKTSKLKFSGTHYLGFVSNNKDYIDGTTSSSNYFETRRNYLQVKGYFFDNPKSYMRMTLDTHQVHNSVDDESDINFGNTGDWEVRLKYAYLYLDNVMPFTGVEFGQVHRPWIDYEEHHGWQYRSIQKTFAEAKQGADFTNSADLGINLKTKMEYFSSELGLFNGEGYHGVYNTGSHGGDGNSLSAEWRLTGHLLGTGEKHVHKYDNYADISFYGQYNTEFEKKGGIDENGNLQDFVWYGLNAVYNQPEFLLSANYVKASDAVDKYKGDGYSLNGELRLLAFDDNMENWNLLARYDYFEYDNYKYLSKKAVIGGVAYKWNKNVEFILSYEGDKLDYNTNYTELKGSNETNSDSLLFTAEVKW
ncbi:hypothetical protein MNB_SV-9-1101 [hydrothermal vent metagenome]|uniref:Uncharacterized protein n=1 Tax=hydrothermal vent metagenome TaxID=652676 RepID=A0A1W1CEU7_9ZZZZ